MWGVLFNIRIKKAISGGTVLWGKTCRLAKGHDVDCLNTE
jgi:hypothetical protein